MQYPLYAPYPYTNVYPCYNTYFATGRSLGQVYGNYYEYQPWMTSRWNPRMIMQQNGKSVEDTTSGFIKNNMMYYPNHQQISPQYAYIPYSLYQYPWSTPYALTNWFNPRQTYNHVIPWSSYYSYDKWTPTLMNSNSGLYYSWPMMNYCSNQIMYPNYLCPSPINWGIQQTIETPQSDSNPKKSTQRTSSPSTLNVTSSDTIRDFNLPPAVAKKTRSDIPRPTVDCSDIKGFELSKEEMDLPYLFRVSDTSIKQIASSRSFGPSMVYNTESDNKPSSAHW